MKINLWQKQRTQTLWCFILFAFGIALYFGLPIEPPLAVLVGTCAALLGFILWKPVVIGRFLFFLCLGMTIACGRTHLIHTTFIHTPLSKQIISGTITTAYATQTGQTFILKDISLKDSTLAPQTIRVSFKGQTPVLHPNDTLTFMGNLTPPNAKQALRFFYQGIEAQGFVKKLLTHHTGETCFWDYLRTTIIQRLRQHLTPTQAEIAIPLVTGEQQVVSANLYDTYRKAGIAHVLSVSGFHMALLAGFVFFLIRGLLSLTPKADTIPAKKIAAIVAFGVTAFYLFLSGHQVPAMRAFMMIALVFLGVLSNRRPVSLYNLILVGFCILLVRPEWITSVSFQFSFVAVMILVGLFEDLSARLAHIRFGAIFWTAVTANILVTLALAPFVAYHFNQFNPYGVVGNLLTSLLFSLFVMPLLFIGVILMPFHLEAPFIKAAGYGLNLITFLAKKIADFPFSEITIPAFSAWGLALIAFGLCFLCLVKTKMRPWGFGFILAGICIGFIAQPKPDLIVGDYGRTILVRNEDGFFEIKGKTDSKTARYWLKKNGQSDAQQLGTATLFIKGYQIALDESGCENADLAILHKKSKSCGAKDIFKPTHNTNYNLFLEDKIIIHSEESDDIFRPWHTSFNKNFNK